MRLPKDPTLAWSLSFWCTANGALALLLSVTAALLSSPASWVSLLIAVALLAALGVLRPEAAASAYRGWNVLATKYAALARECILRVCFFVVLTSASRAGRHSRWPSPTGRRSSWERKGSSGIDTYERSNGRTVKRAWIARYVAWSRLSDNLWSLCLLPYVLLLLALETKEDVSMPERLYTLY